MVKKTSCMLVEKIKTAYNKAYELIATDFPHGKSFAIISNFTQRWKRPSDISATNHSPGVVCKLKNGT